MPLSRDRRAGLDVPRWLTFVVILALGVTVSGVADYLLSAAGYGALGAYVWAVGYAGTVLLLFALYLRPLDLTGPNGVDEAAESDR